MTTNFTEVQSAEDYFRYKGEKSDKSDYLIILLNRLIRSRSNRNPNKTENIEIGHLAAVLTDLLSRPNAISKHF